MPLVFAEIAPSTALDPHLRADLLEVWVAVTDAGGSVGFTAPAPADFRFRPCLPPFIARSSPLPLRDTRESASRRVSPATRQFHRHPLIVGKAGVWTDDSGGTTESAPLQRFSSWRPRDWFPNSRWRRAQRMGIERRIARPIRLGLNLIYIVAIAVA